MTIDAESQFVGATWTLVINGQQGNREVHFSGPKIGQLLAHFPFILDECAPAEGRTPTAGRSYAPSIAPMVRSFDLTPDPNVPQILLEFDDAIGRRSAFALPVDLARALVVQIEANLA